MNEVGPIHERELLLEEANRRYFRRRLDPLIDDALSSRGYIETKKSTRLHLNGYNVIPGPAFRRTLKTPLDALTFQTTYDTDATDSTLIEANLHLARVGNYSGAILRIVGGEAFYKNLSPYRKEDHDDTFQPLPMNEANDILQDIRAHTELGYSSSDTPVSAQEILQELENITPTLNVDRRAHYQLLTDEYHGDIQMDIGESFDDKAVHRHNHVQRRHTDGRKMFRLIARQPLKEGSALVGVKYQSYQRRGRDSDMKLTTVIESDAYSDAEKEAMYRDTLETYQERDMTRFGRGVIKNLQSIIDEDSNVLRLG